MPQRQGSSRPRGEVDIDCYWQGTTLGVSDRSVMMPKFKTLHTVGANPATHVEGKVTLSKVKAIGDIGTMVNVEVITNSMKTHDLYASPFS